MLTDAEVRTLRESAANWHFKRKHSRPLERFRFNGGPLADIEARLDASVSTAAYVGWCVVTPTGPVQALYRASTGTNRLDFIKLDPGTR